MILSLRPHAIPRERNDNYTMCSFEAKDDQINVLCG